MPKYSEDENEGTKRSMTVEGFDISDADRAEYEKPGHVVFMGIPDAYRNAARKLEELFHTAGAYIVTDADRAAAGLPMRDHNGLTLEELVVIEAKMMQAMMETLPGRQIFYEVDGKPAVEKVKP